MHALIVSARTPPFRGEPDFGAEKRLRVFIQAIARTCARLTFVYFVPDHFLPVSTQPGYAAEAAWGVAGDSVFIPTANRRKTFANHYLAGIVAARHGEDFHPFQGSRLHAALAAAFNPAPDLIFVSQLHAMIPFLRLGSRAPILFDLDDLVHRVHWRTAITRPLQRGRLARALQVPAILAAERGAVRLAARTAVCAEADARFLARLGAGSRAVVVPNAVAIPDHATPPTTAPTLLFLGNYAYAPNVQAAERLVRRIWPAILQSHPDARLLLAGGGIERLPSRAAAPDGVDYLGFVPDLAALYAQARIVCCPLDVGGGTRLKLIEAAAHARPIVSTTVGAEGLDLRDGTEILLRDDDASFVQACLVLLADPALCARLGAAARIRAASLYEVGAIRDQVARLTAALLPAAPQPEPST